MSPLLRHLMMRLQAPEGGGEGGGSGSGTPTPPPPAPRAPEPETFSKDYVRELREENKGWRLKASEQEAAAKAAKEAADKATKEAEERVSAAGKAAEQRIIRAELKAEALKAGIIDLDALQLADLSNVKLDDKGNVVGGAEAIEALKKAKPFLFGGQSTTNTGTKPPKNDGGGVKRAVDMTDEEYAAARKAATRR